MPARAKLYSTESEFDEAVETLESHFGLSSGKWCPAGAKEQVLFGDDEGKYVLPLPNTGSYKANHMFSGTVAFDSAWFVEEEEL